jgi:hypothetical protein
MNSGVRLSTLKFKNTVIAKTQIKLKSNYFKKIARKGLFFANEKINVKNVKANERNH